LAINTGLYLKEETAQRAKRMARENKLSVSALVASLIEDEWNRQNPEPPIRAYCSICNQRTEFVFLAYWAEQSNLYQCADCGKIAQYDSLVNDGQERPMIEKRRQQHE